MFAIMQAASCSLKVDAFASMDCSSDSLQCSYMDNPTSCTFLVDHDNSTYITSYYMVANYTSLEANLYTTSDCSGSPCTVYMDNNCTDLIGIP